MEAPQHQDPKFNCLWIISLSEGGDVGGVVVRGRGAQTGEEEEERGRKVQLLEKHH